MISGPLAKYDMVSGKPAAAWETNAHPKASAAKWFGYCHAWSAASVMEAEPTAACAVTLPNGGQMVLDVGDQKGLLTLSHARDVANVFGRRYNGKPGDD